MANEIRIPDELIISTMQGVIDLFLKPKVIELGMDASGQWKESLEPRVNNGNGEIWGMDYTYWLNNGRGPNKDQSPKALKAWAYYYGINVIKPWANSKGIVFDNPIAVAYNIARKGTKSRPERIGFLKDVLNSKEVLDYIYSQLQEGVTIEINKILKKQIHDNFA